MSAASLLQNDYCALGKSQEMLYRPDILYHLERFKLASSSPMYSRKLYYPELGTFLFFWPLTLGWNWYGTVAPGKIHIHWYFTICSDKKIDYLPLPRLRNENLWMTPSPIRPEHLLQRRRLVWLFIFQLLIPLLYSG